MTTAKDADHFHRAKTPATDHGAAVSGGWMFIMKELILATVKIALPLSVPATYVRSRTERRSESVSSAQGAALAHVAVFCGGSSSRYRDHNHYVVQAVASCRK
jgi:hypothetical protein